MNLSYKKYRRIQRFSLHVPILYFTDKQHFTNDVHINQSLSISLLTLFCLFQNKPAPLSKIQKQKEMDTIKKLGSLMLILTISLPCFAKKKVEVKGNFNKRVKTSTSELPIRGWLEDNNKDLLLEFSTNLGTVQVTVTNSMGEVVYNQSVVTKPSVGISLDEEIKEGSTVSITDGKNLVYGEI